MRFRSAPGGPWSDPRGPKTAPRGARSAPRAPQEPPKSLKKGSKKVFVLGWALGAAPGGLREPFWSDFGLGSLRGSILEPFRGDVRAHFGSILVAMLFLLSAAPGSVRRRARAGTPGKKPQDSTRNAPSSKPPARPRSGRARAPSDSRRSLFGCVRCSCPSCLAAPGAGALAFSLCLLLLLLVSFLPCWQLSLGTRFPFHDSQVYFRR